MSDAGAGHPLELLSSYLDDELDLAERTSVDRHLALCDRCRQELESLQLLSVALRDDPAPEPPVDLLERVGRRIDEAGVVPLRARRRFVVPASIAATVAAVGLLVALQWRRESVPPAAEPAPRESNAATESSPRERDAIRQGEPAAPAVPSTRAVAPIEPQRQDAEGRTADAPAPSVPFMDRTTAAAGDEARSKAAEEKQEFAAAPPPEIEPLQKDTMAAAESALAPVAASKAHESVCGERWVDTAVLASWVTTDRDRAMSRLAAAARSLGGRSEPVEPYESQIALIVPRSRVPELITSLTQLGVTGLAGPVTPEEGFECVRQRVSVDASSAR